MGTEEDRMTPQQRQRLLVVAASELLAGAAELEGGPRLRDRIGVLSTEARRLVDDFDSLRGGPVCANCDEAIELQPLNHDPERAAQPPLWVHTTGDTGRTLCHLVGDDSLVATPRTHKAPCPSCGQPRPEAIDDHNFVPGSVCPSCGHVEPAVETRSTP